MLQRLPLGLDVSEGKKRGWVKTRGRPAGRKNCFERLMIFRWIIQRFASQIEVKLAIINIQSKVCASPLSVQCFSGGRRMKESAAASINLIIPEPRNSHKDKNYQ